jgi:hypothetical protein
LPKDEPEATEVANSYFGPDRYAGRPYYGGNIDGDNDENFVIFKSGDLELVLVSFQFNDNPTDEVLAWSRSVFESHPRALGMAATHYIVTGGGNFSPQGQAIYDALKDVDNVQLMASGHVAQDARKSDTFEGNVIHSMLSDYQRSAPKPSNPEEPEVVEQGLTNGGLGYMRIWTFMPSRQALFVESYSPKLDASYTNDQNEFELPVDLLGAGRGPFVSLGTAEVADDGTARVTLPNTAPDTVGSGTPSPATAPTPPSSRSSCSACSPDPEARSAHCCDSVALYASSPVSGSMNRTSTSSATGSNVINNACGCDDPNGN